MSSSNITGSSDKQHQWIRKHFSHPPFCYVCNTLICDVGKIANYCKSCHLTSHLECNVSYQTIPGYCTIVKHDWVKDGFENAPICSGCNHYIFSFKEKASGYTCSKCSFKCHKNCRNLTQKCEPISKSLFSLKSKLDLSSIPPQHIGSFGQPISTSTTTTTTLNISSNLSTSAGSGSCNSNSNSHVSLTQSTPAINTSKSSSLTSTPPHTPTSSGLSSSTIIQRESSQVLLTTTTSTTSVFNNNLTNDKSPTHKDSPQQWTIPNLPNFDSSNNLNNRNSINSNNNGTIGGGLTLCINSSSSSNNSGSSIQNIPITDYLFELDHLISFTPSMATTTQKQLFVQQIVSFFHGLSCKMDSNYDLSRHISSCNSSNNSQNGKTLGSTLSSYDEDFITSGNVGSGSSRHIMAPIKFRSIQHLFHNEMINYGRYRTPSQIDHYRTMIELFLQIIISTPWKEDNEYILRIALDFYSFLNTHKKDPENVLIGMTPSKDIQRRCKKYFYVSDSKTDQQQIQNHSRPTSLLASSSSNTTFSSNLQPNSIQLNNNISNNNLNNFKKSKYSYDLRVSRPTLLQHITSWAGLEDKELVMKMLREFSTILEKERMTRGDLVIIKLPKNWDPTLSDSIVDPNHHEFDEGSFTFARYQREADVLGINCYVYILPDETKALRIPHSRVVPLSMIDINVPTDRVKLEKMITNPYDAFQTELNSAIKETTKHMLIQRGVNVAQIDASLNFNGTVSVSLEQLSQIRTQMAAIHSDEPFLAEIDRASNTFIQFFSHYLKKVYMNESKGNYQIYFSKENQIDFPSSLVAEFNSLFIYQQQQQQQQKQSQQQQCNNTSIGIYEDDYYESTDQSTICLSYFSMIKKQYSKFKPFLPTIKSLITDLDLKKGAKSLMAKDALVGLLSVCDCQIDTVLAENLRLLDGTKKKELSSWWLTAISSTVDSYLSERGFDSSAVPDNYIDQRPASMSKVRENLRIVNLVLKPSTRIDMEDRLNNLIIPLKNKVYYKINEFLLGAQNLLYEKLKKHTNLIVLPKNMDENQEMNLKEIQNNIKQMINNYHLNQAQQQTSSSSPQHSADFNSIMTLSNLIGDVVYIREMKTMEEKFYSNDILMEYHQKGNMGGGGKEKERLSDIVPITGLVFSRLLRIKHELRTVLEVFDEMPRSPFPNVTHDVVIGSR